MTIKQTLLKMLGESGMAPENALTVFEAMAGLPQQRCMAERWNDDAEGYPPQLLAGLWEASRAEGLHWIDEHQPLAWYRPMFVDEIINEAK